MTVATLDAPVRPSPVTDLSPEELAWLNGPGREGRYEYVDGRAVKKPMSYDANRIAGRVSGYLFTYLAQNPIADVLIEQEYQCFPGKPRQMRKPDVSLILLHRVPMPRPSGYLRFVPDLAVEVVSPNDTVYDLDAKLEDYRSAGFPLVWTVNPDARLVRVFAAGQPVVERRAGDTLDAGPLLPGFAVAVDHLVPEPSSAQPA